MVVVKRDDSILFWRFMPDDFKKSEITVSESMKYNVVNFQPATDKINENMKKY